MKKAIILMILFNIAVFAQTFTDERDGKSYNTVKIGEQIWMAQNMDYNAIGSKCYSNKPENCNKYGRLYTWELAKRACPAGWHLPSDKEWQALVDFASGELSAGKKSKAKKEWEEYDFSKRNPTSPKCKWVEKKTDGESVEYDHCVTDQFGFTALPGGYYSNGYFMSGNLGYWWTSTEFDEYSSWFRSMYYSFSSVLKLYFDKDFQLSVRCVKN
ncbi:MAG: hypothetical protein FWB90_01020 [Fibromonadales bacterium]|nr:hypothetical protein [Fibromonadales bacterium]